jgi:hypothetical protein
VATGADLQRLPAVHGSFQAAAKKIDDPDHGADGELLASCCLVDIKQRDGNSVMLYP